MTPADNKFHVGNGTDGKHYWLTPPALYEVLSTEFSFNFDPCPYPKPEDFDGLTCEWGTSNYVNPPFGSIIHQGKKKGPTAWARKAIEENKKGKRVVLVYPIDKWVLMLLAAGSAGSQSGRRSLDGHGGRFARERHWTAYCLLRSGGKMMKIYTARSHDRSHPVITSDPCLAEVFKAKGWSVTITETSDTVSKWPVWLFYSAAVLGIVSCLMWLYAKFAGLS